MQSCTLGYIPDYLHSKGKDVNPIFSIGEELYYRCNPEDYIEPYQRISLYDISHNRNFNDSIAFPKKDVLLNVDSSKEFEIIEGKTIVTIVIKTLNEYLTFEKLITSSDDEVTTARIRLLHDPIPCMYPHSVFEISVNGVVVNKENYSEILNRNNKIFKNLRRDIRHELTSILFTGNIDNDSETEVITIL